MARVTNADGSPLRLSVTLFGAPLAFQVWRVDVGRVPLLLLDAELPGNDAVQRWTTARLYEGNRAVRLAQYGLLGIGGARVLEALGIEPAVIHLNEGHPALAALELAAARVAAGTPVRGGARGGARARRLHDAHAGRRPGTRPTGARSSWRRSATSPGASASTRRRFLDLCRVDPGDGRSGPG